MSQQYHDPIRGDYSDKHDSGLDAAEKQHVERAPADYDNPFGNEDSAEVRYRTLHWWFVPKFEENYTTPLTVSSMQAMWHEYVATMRPMRNPFSWHTPFLTSKSLDSHDRGNHISRNPVPSISGRNARACSVSDLFDRGANL